ncbi:MAG: hypothetical protein ACRD1J_11255 [Terriglobia bacterium]
MKAKLLLFVLALVLVTTRGIPAQQNKSDAARTRSVSSLAEVHMIYVKPMPNSFDQYLTAELLKRLPKGIMLTQNKDRADATLEGVDENSAHGISRTVNQVFGVGGSASGAVKLLSSDGQILWATEKSDHTIPVYGTWREHGMSKVAARIAKSLAGSLRAAQKRAKHGS